MEERELLVFAYEYVYQDMPGEAFVAIPFSDSTIAVAGYTDSAGSSIAFFARFSIDGEMKWRVDPLNGKKGSILGGIKSSDGTVILTGEIEGSTGDKDIVVLKTTYEGEVLWLKTWDSTLADKGLAVKEAEDGKIHVLGLAQNFKLVILILDGQGNEIHVNWTELVGHNNCRSIIPRNGGAGYVVAESGEWMSTFSYNGTGQINLLRQSRRGAKASSAADIGGGLFAYVGNSSNGSFLSYVNPIAFSEATVIVDDIHSVLNSVYSNKDGSIDVVGNNGDELFVKSYDKNRMLLKSFFYGKSEIVFSARVMTSITGNEKIFVGSATTTNTLNKYVLILKSLE
ncbi:MAG TPA: hypothetical protein PLG25_11395 [bacterium]|nr:hypothetical protein [bacterium]HMW34054.1 hypothetical protein [bacterium]HMW35140.1 hypothetical protein [bacterium]HMY36797.1 hypothetical protein [bacterium]HMZ04935.1 hypothetical protein [bacterium]